MLMSISAMNLRSGGMTCLFTDNIEDLDSSGILEGREVLCLNPSLQYTSVLLLHKFKLSLI